jgi:hypothetical protein
MIPQPKMTLSKSIAYPGNATINHLLAKDGQLKIHGLCRHAKVDDVKSWRRSKGVEGRELTFSDPKRLIGCAYLGRSVGPHGAGFCVTTHPLGNPWGGARISMTRWGGFLHYNPPTGLPNGLPRTQSCDVLL